MNRSLKNFILRIARKFNQDQQKRLLLLGRDKAQAIKSKINPNSLADVEFRIFSQWGEDGIIQYLISKIDIPNKIFVEFGVENYLESNTRFLLINDNWSGLVIDGSRANINFIKKDPISWRHDITAIHSFITKDNINELIRQTVNEQDIGLLSIDIDGNDYWILDEIKIIKPRILICEYNSVFGGRHAVTTPYSPGFVRRKAHFSDLYFGASLTAICDLADAKGFDFVGTNSAGVNAFFIRKDLSGPFKKYKPQEIFFPSNIRESRDENGKLNFLAGEKRLDAIKNLQVYDTTTKQLVLIKDLFKL
jgi:hypothetical protein